MKANELMIGDLVRFPIGNEKVVDLPYIEGKGMCASFAASATLFPVEVEKLEPISLTPEVLEKNGFRQDKKCPFVYETDDEDVIIDLYDPDPNARLSKKEDYDKMVGVRLSPAPPYGFSYWGQSLMIRANYVHELQHALRLCGIKKEIEI